MKKVGRKVLLCIALITGILCVAACIIIYFYPTIELSGCYSQPGGIVPGHRFCFQINKNGTIDYYIDCSEDIVNHDVDELKSAYYTSKKLNLSERIYLNNLSKSIKESKECTYEQFGDLYYLCKIDNKLYYSRHFEYPIFEDSVELFVERYNIDIIELCLWAWFIKPEECNEYWDFQSNAFPFEHMGITKDNYEEWIDEMHNQFIDNKAEIERLSNMYK